AGLADERLNLLETLAERIAAEVLAHPRAAQIRVRVEKLDRVPGALGVTLTRRRGRVDPGTEALRPVLIYCGAALPAKPDGAVILTPAAPGLPLPGGGNGWRVALLALDQAAWALAGDLGLDVADSRAELDWAVKAGQPIVWAPARMVGDVAGLLGAEPVALALWLAERMGAQRLDLALPEGAGLPALDSTIPLSRITP
ncbi:MAG: dihydroneopterin aldolase, partial [Paracoccus sp. (in: a-proteobacteria)]|nr:dihydroneopterin aldolase [Paracoccus sp. (in: a-proteobacteria)]